MNRSRCSGDTSVTAIASIVGLRGDEDRRSQPAGVKQRFASDAAKQKSSG